jgi:hypothetical protein
MKLKEIGFIQIGIFKMKIPTICHCCGKETFHKLENPVEVKNVYVEIQKDYYCERCIDEGWIQQTKKQ